MKKQRVPETNSKTEYWRAALIGCVLCALIVMAPVITVGIHRADHYEPLLDSSDVRPLTSGWRDENGVLLDANLYFDWEGGRRQSYSILLPEDDPALRDPYLMLTVRYFNVDFYLDDVFIGQCLAKPEGADSSQGAILALQPLPADYAGKELRLDVELLLSKDVTVAPLTPELGSRSGLLSELIQKNAVLMLLDLVIMFFGLLLLTMGLLPGSMRKEGRLLNIGCFAVAFSLYSMCVVGVGKLFLPNNYFVYLMEFLLLAVLPIPLLMGYLPQATDRCRKLMYIPLALLCLNLPLQLFIHLCTPLELRSTVWITHVLIVFSILFAGAALVDVWRTKRERGPLLICIPIIAGVVVDLIRFYVYQNYQATVGVKLGVLIFIILQTVTLIQTYLNYYGRELQNKIYQRMAFTDILTDLGNRAAFERREAELQRDLAEHSALWCLCADVNDLKKVNDAHGHSAGDELLRGVAEVLRRAAERCGTAYRTGGDEFVIFFVDQPPEAPERFEARMQELLKEYNDTHHVSVSVATGLERLRADGTDSVAELVERADRKMYDNKRAYHAGK